MKTYLITFKATDIVVATDEDEAMRAIMSRHNLETTDFEDVSLEEYFDEEKAEEHRHGLV